MGFMELSALVQLAQTKGYRPFFDEAGKSLVVILEELANVGINPVVLKPGNDLYSHAFEVEQKGYVFQVMIRFDLRIFALMVYRKSGTARYSLPYEVKYEPMLKPILDVLLREGFQEISPEIGNYSLGDEPLAQGMMANTLFAFYFEDG